jgi:hypothetical protein
MIRGRGGNRLNPNCVQFISDYRAVSIDLLFVKSNSSNCEDDLDMFALKLKDLTDAVSEPHSPPPLPPPSVSNDVFNDDLIAVAMSPLHFPLAECNVITYIAGYIVKKSVLKYPCSVCANIMKAHTTVPSAMFIHQKMYNSECQMIVPSFLVLTFVNHLEDIFRKSTQFFHQSGLFSSFNNHIQSGDIDIILPSCHYGVIKSYIIKLFFIIRINHYLREQNRDLKEPNKKRNGKIMKLLHL